MLSIDSVDIRYVYTLFGKYSKPALWEFHEIEKKITRKIKALSKKRSFQNISFEDSVPLNIHLQITTQPGSVTVEKMGGIFAKRI